MSMILQRAFFRTSGTPSPTARHTRESLSHTPPTAIRLGSTGWQLPSLWLMRRVCTHLLRSASLRSRPQAAGCRPYAISGLAAQDVSQLQPQQAVAVLRKRLHVQAWRCEGRTCAWTAVGSVPPAWLPSHALRPLQCGSSQVLGHVSASGFRAGPASSSRSTQGVRGVPDYCGMSASHGSTLHGAEEVHKMLDPQLAHACGRCKLTEHHPHAQQPLQPDARSDGSSSRPNDPKSPKAWAMPPGQQGGQT